MKKIGFIGCGHMASSMLSTFIRNKLINPSDVIVSEISETAKRLKQKKEFSSIEIVNDNIYTAKNSNFLFFGVKPLAVIDVLSEIKNSLNPDTQHIVSIAACVELSIYETFFKGKVTRTLPTIISESGNGTIFVTHNSLVDSHSAGEVEKIIGSLGGIEHIKEEDYASAVNITSSAPGILAAIFGIYADSTMKNSSIPKDVAGRLLIKTILGTVRMITDNNMTFEELADSVATKGGITEAALNVLKSDLPDVFDMAIFKSIIKDKEVKALLKSHLDAKVSNN